MKRSRIDRRIDRRGALRKMGALIAYVPLARLAAACGSRSDTSDITTDGGTSAASDATSAAGDAGASAETGTATGWASGGTASMTAKASYPNPFAAGAPTACTKTGALTEGPCYDSMAETIADISYGQPGLPVRLMFQVLDASCKPIANATVSVWHCDPNGVYSGNDSAHENVAFCTGNKADYMSHLYFRGVQTTDANGVVAFDTCFPGWYAGRTIHIHFTVTSGATTFTSQYVFDDALDDEIVSTQPVYDARPKRDTSNGTDTVVSASTYKTFLFQTQQMTDGAMLAWGTITLG
jgi:protocatechuate 3,4-dioxygenase beta subunit